MSETETFFTSICIVLYAAVTVRSHGMEPLCEM